MKKYTILTLLASSCLLAFPGYAQTKTNMHLLHTYHISGEGKWDYLLADPATSRLYVSHGTMVQILNEKTGDSLGIIPNTSGVHGIAVVNGLKKACSSYDIAKPVFIVIHP